MGQRRDCLGLRPGWLGLGPSWLGRRAGWLGLRPDWLGLRPGWLGLKTWIIPWHQASVAEKTVQFFFEMVWKAKNNEKSQKCLFRARMSTILAFWCCFWPQIRLSRTKTSRIRSDSHALYREERIKNISPKYVFWITNKLSTFNRSIPAKTW